MDTKCPLLVSLRRIHSLVTSHPCFLRIRLRLHGTLERFCMEPFRVGTDRLPGYTISLNRSVQNRSFQASMHEQFQTTDSLSIYQEHEKFVRKFSHHTFVLRSLTQNVLREQIFQLSSAILSRISPCLVSKRT